MASEQPKVTVSFTVSLYDAALLMALYDLRNTAYEDYDDLAPQTVENYTTLLCEVADAYCQQRLLEVASVRSEELEKSIADFLKV